MLPLGFGADGKQDGPTESVDNQFVERSEYDQQGRKSVDISFEGVYTRYHYSNVSGRLTRKEFFASAAAYANGSGSPDEVWAYSYTDRGQIAQLARTKKPGTAQESIEIERTFYDDQHRLARKESPQGAVNYQYDEFDRLLSVSMGHVNAPERVTRYTYDLLGRLKTVQEDVTPSVNTDPTLNTTYDYDAEGRIDHVRQANGVVEDYDYDLLGRVERLTTFAPDATPNDLTNNRKHAQYDYTYRDDGKKTQAVESFWANPAASPSLVNMLDYQYDALGRLTREELDSSDNTLDYIAAFTFDLNSNRFQKTSDRGGDGSIDETRRYTVDANDRLLWEFVDDVDNSLDAIVVYDWSGTQQVGKREYKNIAPADVNTATPDKLTSTLTFAYDAQGRMREALATRYAAGVATRREKTEYGYSTTGYRVSSTSYVDETGSTGFTLAHGVEFLADEHSLTGYAQTLRETHFDGAGQLSKTIDYSYGKDELTQTTRTYDAAGSVTSEETLLFGHDAHGSVRLLTTLAGAVEQLFLYDAYGEAVALFNVHANALARASLESVKTSYRHDGEFHDSRINGKYLRARWQQDGRFTSLDPYSGDVNTPLSFHKYGFVHGDPVQGIDPSGEMLSSINLGGLTANVYIGLKIASIGLNTIGFVGNSYRAWDAASQGKFLSASISAIGALADGAALAFELATGFRPPTPPPSASLQLIGGGLRTSSGMMSIPLQWQWIIKGAPALASWTITNLIPSIATSTYGILGTLLFMQGGGFRGDDTRTTREIRNTPGIATGGENLLMGDANWLKEGMGYFPKQVADTLRGKMFNNWREFREAFWKAVANTDEIARGFSQADRARMATGISPLAPRVHQLGKKTAYEIDHMDSIEIMGKRTLYDMDQMMILAAKIHASMHKAVKGIF